MAVISLSDITVSFGTRIVLERVGFSLEEGDHLGIIGVNGCGKSTLLKVITGELTPDDGQVFIGRGKTIGLLRQDDAFEVDLAAGDSPLSQMIAAFPELLAAEAELAELEQALRTRAHEAGSAAYATLAAS